MESKPSGKTPSFKLVDVIISLLQRDLIGEALETIVTVIEFAAENDMDTEEAMRMSIDDMVKMVPEPPQRFPYVPQVRGNWDKVYYGDAAFRRDEE